jgi:spore coat protein CotH
MRSKGIAILGAFLVGTMLLAGCSKAQIRKEHVGIPAEYESFLFEKGKLNQIEINMDDWEVFIQKSGDEKRTGSVSEQLKEKVYDSCNVTINGEELQNAGIRTKGIYTHLKAVDTDSDRFSLVLKLNEFEKQKYHGLRMIDLNSNIMDATAMKDAVTYDMCRYIGLPAPMCNYAMISVNGEYFGCYLAVEPVGKDFCKRNYGEDYGSLYKPLHDLRYTGIWSGKYKYIKDMVKIERSSFSNVKAALKSVHNKRDIEKHVDVDSVLKYMAVQTMVVNMDGLTGEILHNYYLYESDGIISLIPWDYDMAFGGMLLSNEEMFSKRMKAMETGSFDKEEWLREKEKANTAEVKKIVNMPIDTPFIGDLSEREFFMNLLDNEGYKEKYHKYLAILAEQYVQGGELDETITVYANEIKDIVGTEHNAPYSSEEYAAAVEMLRKFLQKKAESVIGQLNGYIPADRTGQEQEPDKLIDTSDIDVRLMGSSDFDKKKEA